MAARLNAERTCIPAAAHNPNVEAPATTAHALTTFWNAAERYAARQRRPATLGRPRPLGVADRSRPRAASQLG